MGLTLHAKTAEAPFAFAPAKWTTSWDRVARVLTGGDEITATFMAAGFAARDAGLAHAGRYRWPIVMRALAAVLHPGGAAPGGPLQALRWSQQPRRSSSHGRPAGAATTVGPARAPAVASRLRRHGSPVRAHPGARVPPIGACRAPDLGGVGRSRRCHSSKLGAQRGRHRDWCAPSGAVADDERPTTPWEFARLAASFRRSLLEGGRQLI
jgi:hypothetical protein